jgi:adenine-specific DNA-methyltransferase
MIKYLGSKRTLVPIISGMARATGAKTAADLFTGTTRVAQSLKTGGALVTASDIASYSGVLSDCYIATDKNDIDADELADVVAQLNAMPGKSGYFTQTFCEESRFFQPKNGARIDAIREAIEANYRQSPLYPILLTSLLEAADRVDSTTGIQMAYLKQWAPRAHRDLTLTVPELLEGPGKTIVGDASQIVDELDPVDLMYLDPPYNQHRYYTNYHIWETLIRWDNPETYGIARKRMDARDDQTKSVYNYKRTMPSAFADLIQRVRAEVLLVSYNDEGWITADEMVASLRAAGHEEVQMLAFDYKRYVGAQIGIFNREGNKVGKVSHLRNVEYIFVAGPGDLVQAAIDSVSAGDPAN